MILLRRATASDAPVILELLRRAFQEYDGVLDPPSGVHKETLDSVREKMEMGAWTLAFEHETPVGCVWHETRGECVYLGRLAVLPEARGRGIGRALMDEVETQARAEKIYRVQLGVRAALPELRATYERRGYRVTAAQAHAGYREPTYFTLEKELPRT